MSKAIRKYSCMIVDDEPLARQVVERYVKQTPELELIGSYANVHTALGIIKEKRIDLLFLDIKMPELNGFQFIEMLQDKKPKVILITAYSEFALKAFEYGVSDYLMKPISYKRFLKSLQLSIHANEKTDEVETNSKNILYLKSGHALQKIEIKAITYIEAFGNFTKVHYGKETLLASENLSTILSKLPETFIRIHKSYVISLDKIEKVDRKHVRISGTELPIGNTYKKLLSEKFKPV